MQIVKPSFSIEGEVDGLGMLKAIEKAGRTCYKSEAKITDTSCLEFAKKIIASGHESVLEHEKVTVRIICDRGVSHEIVRHRICSFSQESTRYCTYGEGKRAGEVTFIEPLFYKPHSYQWYVWVEAMQRAENAYLDLLNAGSSAQQARSVLPNSLKTELVMTANLREWRHFFKLRTAPAAHPSMREITIPMLEEFKRRIPVIFDDLSSCSTT